MILPDEARRVTIVLGFHELSILRDGDFAHVVESGERTVFVSGGQPGQFEFGKTLFFKTVAANLSPH